MSKEDESEKKWTYSGDENEWDSFDRRMIRYMRKKYDVFGERLWLGTVEVVSDDMDPHEFLDHCRDVMKAIAVEDPSEARKLKRDMDEFEDPEWQWQWMNRQLQLMVDYIESHAKGQAELEVINYSGRLIEIRKHLYKQFGSGSGGNIHEKELDYDRGMPEKGKVAFPAGCDMGEKLRQLESRRLYFMRMAGTAEKRATYTYCQEPKLVRIVIDHVNQDEYGDCVRRVLDAVKTRRLINSAMNGEDIGFIGIPDQHERSFNDDWLPSWALLKASLLDEWNMRSSEVVKPKDKGKGVLPVAMGSTKVVNCYGCGKQGHKKGDPSCKAGKFDFHVSAPQDYKDRMEKGRKRESDKKPSPKTPGKTNKSGGGEKKLCHAFNKGNCRYGAKCKYLHEKSSGEGQALKGFTAEQQKLVTTLLSSAMKRTAAAIAKKSKKEKKKVKLSKEKEASESGDDEFSSILASCFLAPVKNCIRRDFVPKSGVVLAADLHSVHKNCGIDSDAGMSISTLREDFMWIDDSEEAKESIQSPSGINGGTSVVGGRGPMVVRAKTGEYLVDPDAVFLKSGESQPNFRVMSTQRLKVHGVRVVGCFKGTDVDVLQDRTSKKTIELSEEGPTDKKILVLETIKCPKFVNVKASKRVIEDIRMRNRSAMVEDMEGESNSEANVDEQVSRAIRDCEENGISNAVMAFNLAKISDEERSRLYCRRFGYCNPQLLKRMSEDSDFGEVPRLVNLNEDNAIQDAAKFKKKAHYRNDAELSMGRPPWFRVYVDGAGGGKSMGCESYEGAIGSYLFVCSSTGEIHHKLYASHEQFPAALFQFLVHVESEGNRCHELYCDTFSANISAEVEEVAALFLVKIVPVSAGTPQEVSFVETANRTIAGRSRAMMLGAPHLPKWCWALADKHAVYVGRLLPQSTREWKSSYFLNMLKAPDWRHMFVHVFGAPCAFSPVDGPVHKRGAQTVDGYYVGVQHPMVMVIRKSDMKLMSVSKKKVIVYESMYVAPLSVSSEKLGEILAESQVVPPEEAPRTTGPRHVQSIKSVSSHKIPIPNTSASQNMRPPTRLDESADSQSPSQGEGVIVPEHLSYDDDLATGIQQLKEKAATTINDPGIRKKVIDSITNLQNISSRVVEPNQLKAGKKVKSQIDVANIVQGKRRREGDGKEVAAEAPPKKKVKEKHVRAKFGLKPGDIVSVSPKLFDGKVSGSYSKQHPERQFGNVKRVWAGKKLAQIEWIDGSKNLVRFEDLRVEKVKVDAAFIVTVMMMNQPKAPKDPLDKEGWPRDFFEAMVSPDWREWVLAIKKEIASWNDFNAYTEIPFASRTPGSSIVPLGELFTRKRDLSFKFRQYLMGNLLKKGKDYDETFSSCISWDGIRWCAAVACATDKLIHGLDAVTGFLQAKEQFDLYAFLPSHGQYSSLSFEQLAIVRKKLLDLVKKDGVQGLKKFAAAHKKESRSNPKVCYRLNSSIYGAPSANHEWEMLFQHAHINGCGLTLSEIEPSLYIKIEVDEKDEVSGWMIANVWTDDVRYFGTDDVIRKYEENLQKHVKVKLLGVPGEFVGTEFHQDLERGLCELKSPKYWEAALLKVGKYFEGGVKERYNPLSVYDEGIMQEEVTDEEFEAAKNLEYRELCGIVSYPAACTKLEMRYAVSVCGRHRSKWGIKQFKILKKVFEYGYTTRHLGIIYSKGLDVHGDNTTYCFADSGHSVPRSYGCTISMMNGAVTSLSAKKHTLTATSTCHDELIEFSIAVNRMVGFRNMMCEMGLEQEQATTIYQDNEAAISIAMNRGSLSKQSRHMDRRILTARNKIEDVEVIPKYCLTARMLADIGTKALPDPQFAYLRDEINGYALVRQHHPSYPMPAYVSTKRKEIQK